MTDRLFGLLVLLTLLDVAFVQATEIVATVELLPLWALTAASFWLRRLQRHRAYRVGWNGCVLLVFALLVHHATTTGLLHMLEDGLVLAVLCQVHLLNNLGARQRPDLIFFNSFLIAFVTSFFAPDVSWSGLFVVHAFVLVPGLQLHALLLRAPDAGADVVRRLLRTSVPHTLAVGVVTALVFVVWPRDFRRDGWLGDAVALQQRFQAGLAERIRLDDEQPARLGDGVVAHLQPQSGRPGDVPAHWRTAAFSIFDGGGWSPQDASRLGSRFGTDPPWLQRGDGSWYRESRSSTTAVVRVRLHDLSSRRLPCPLTSVRLAPLAAPDLMVDAKSFGGFAVVPVGDAGGTPVDYEVEIAASAGSVPTSSRTVRHFTALPDRTPEVVRTLAARLRATAPPDADRLELARIASTWLQQARRYQLPGGPGFARNLGEFLLGSGAGHCEYFATALALLLRVQDVPCRLVGGWLAHEWNATLGAVVVRQKHAHAWVEVLDAAGRWHTFDPTPAADLMADAASASWWTSLRSRLEACWARVTGFDQDARQRWLAWLRRLPSEHSLELAVLVVAAAVWLGLRRRRRQRHPAIAALHRALRRAGLALRAGETPRELLARAAHAGLPPRRLQRLLAAAHTHEACRYGAPGSGSR